MSKEKQKIGILGYGEIGKSLANFYQSAKIKDLNRDDGLEGVDILNICIPWSENFVEIVKEEIERIKPKLTIIHSTVAPGTTKEIGGMVVHSPVRGMHPDLAPGIRTFIKYIGTDNEEAGEIAKNHLEGLGIKTRVFNPSVTTELGKLFSTSYYGLCIAWHGEMKKMCDKFGADFSEAASDFNRTYNEGYEKLGLDDVIRPTLYPPGEGIGGHCIVPNAEMLDKFFDSKAIDLILKYKKHGN